jgi:hypothetical protein
VAKGCLGRGYIRIATTSPRASTEGGVHVAVDNRLTAEQLAALVPGDPVTIEFARDFRRPKHVAGTVVRFIGSQIVVSCRSDRGVPYVHHFDRRGIRVGGGGHAELVTAAVPEQVSAEQRRQPARVDAAYREWTRNRDDVDRLRELHEAIDECLNDRLIGAD